MRVEIFWDNRALVLSSGSGLFLRLYDTDDVPQKEWREEGAVPLANIPLAGFPRNFVEALDAAIRGEEKPFKIFIESWGRSVSGTVEPHPTFHPGVEGQGHHKIEWLRLTVQLDDGPFTMRMRSDEADVIARDIELARVC